MHVHVRCNQCGWIYMPISWNMCAEWERERMSVIPDDAEEMKLQVPMNPYIRCYKCGNSYRNFSEVTPIAGSDFLPILSFREKIRRQFV